MPEHIKLSVWIDRMNAATDGDEAFDIFAAAAKSVGFEEADYRYGAVGHNVGRPHDLEIQAIRTIKTTLGADTTQFLDNAYNERRLFENDPAVRRIEEGGSDYILSGRAFYDLGMLDLTPDEEALVLRRTDVVLPEAHLIFPLMSPESGDVPSAALNAYSNLKGDTLQSEFQHALSLLKPLVPIFQVKARALTAKTIADNIALTPREKQCIQLIARGFRPFETAERLGISKSMADRHIASARRKLRATTTAQAVARGLQIGLLSL